MAPAKLNKVMAAGESVQLMTDGGEIAWAATSHAGFAWQTCMGGS
jgi:hypothetical protein